MLARRPDLRAALSLRPTSEELDELLDAFDVTISYDKPNRQLELSATIARRPHARYQKAQRPPRWRSLDFRHSGGRIRTCDLRVMSPTSYLAAPPRGGLAMVATGRWAGAGWRRLRKRLRGLASL